MDDLDNFFGDDAADAFVAGIKFDMVGDDQAFDPNNMGAQGIEIKHEFARAVLESDDLLYNSVLGETYEKDIKSGKYQSISKGELGNLLYKSNLAGELYPKQKETIMKVIEANKEKDNYNEQDLASITRELVQLSLEGKISAVDEGEESKIQT